MCLIILNNFRVEIGRLGRFVPKTKSEWTRQSEHFYVSFLLPVSTPKPINPLSTCQILWKAPYEIYGVEFLFAAFNFVIIINRLQQKLPSIRE